MRTELSVLIKSILVFISFFTFAFTFKMILVLAKVRKIYSDKTWCFASFTLDKGSYQRDKLAKILYP